MKTQIVFSGSLPQRADTFLAENFPEHSRSFFARLMSSGKVLVNDKAETKAGLALKTGDVIQFDATQPKLSPTPEAASVEFTVVEEQKNFIVIDKPAGVLVHSTSPNSSEPSLVDGLIFRFSQLKEMPDNLRAGIVHRLDKETSGLILVAKNCNTQAKLSDLFASRTIKKTYLAIVEGQPNQAGTINAPIGRHPTERHKMAANGFAHRQALTEYSVLKRFENYSLIEVQLHTGRTHQIRVHMAHIGHPVLGDFLYGTKSTLISRQALHAHKLEFVLEGKAHSFTAKIPTDINNLLDNKTAKI